MTRSRRGFHGGHALFGAGSTKGGKAVGRCPNGCSDPDSIDRDAARRDVALGDGAGRADRGFDVVCLSHLRWGFVYQRPQHLLRRFAPQHRVFFFEEPVPAPKGAEPSLRVTEMEPGVWAAVPQLPEGLPPAEGTEVLARLLEGLLRERGVHRYVLWFYTPMAAEFTRGLRPLATVYDCMDELSAFAGAPTTLLDREGELLDSADLVFTGGRSLYEAKRRRHPHVFAFPSSVDKEHFFRAREPGPEPDDQALLDRPRVGFFGVIDERLDVGLLKGAATLRPRWEFVLVGPVVKIDPALLPAAPNLHYVGLKDYEVLPEYLRGWDAAMLPFARNEFTRYISPTKTPEYLAAGRPVVSTSIPDVVRPYGEQGLVRIADTPEAFVEALEAAMTEDAGARLARVDAFLVSTSWDRTWAEMKRLLDAAIERRESRTGAGGGALLPAGDGLVEVEAAIPDGVPEGGSIVVEPRGFDVLVVGAGFAGSVLAERLASQAGMRVLVVERRNHVGGNAYDHHDDAGILIHRYGPHIFHTNSTEVFEYLSRFTAWRPYSHRVLASVDGLLLPIPINLDTINELYGLRLSSFELEEFFAARAERVEPARTSEDVVVGRVGRELYEKFFRGYTRKQWGLDPSELDAQVTARVPVRTNRDARYFTDTYQTMPLHGYARLFERMLDHPNIKVMLGTDHREIAPLIPYRQMVYTGAIDEFFGSRFGRLPYRSLDFATETFDVASHQPAPVVNYPNEEAYTRITEFKYLTGQRHPKTTVMYEYPRADGDPYYPVPRPENAVLYRRYRALAEQTPGVHFVGRLATYKYYNMDQVVAQALAVFRRLSGAGRSERGGDVLGATLASGGMGRDRVHA
jgi:UDP-galactopyranose mutase